MKNGVALIFGSNDYTVEIKKNIQTEYKGIYVLNYANNDTDENSFDFSDNWDLLKNKVNIDDCTAFCVLEDMAENIFLTISLRDTFHDLPIIALSQDKESKDKLMLAGATNILSTTQTTADVIVDMLHKPRVTKVLHDVLYDASSLKVAQITVENDSVFDNTHTSDARWNKEYGIIIILLVQKDDSRDFIYTSQVKKKRVSRGDTLVVLGYEADIKSFKKLLGEMNEN